jgi:hypothetical protein
LKSALNPPSKQAFEKKLLGNALVGSALWGILEGGHASTILDSGPLNIAIAPSTTEHIDIDGLAASTIPVLIMIFHHEQLQHQLRHWPVLHDVLTERYNLTSSSPPPS